MFHEIFACEIIGVDEQGSQDEERVSREKTQDRVQGIETADDLIKTQYLAEEMLLKALIYHDDD